MGFKTRFIYGFQKQSNQRLYVLIIAACREFSCFLLFLKKLLLSVLTIFLACSFVQAGQVYVAQWKKSATEIEVEKAFTFIGDQHDTHKILGLLGDSELVKRVIQTLCEVSTSILCRTEHIIHDSDVIDGSCLAFLSIVNNRLRHSSSSTMMIENVDYCFGAINLRGILREMLNDIDLMQVYVAKKERLRISRDADEKLQKRFK